MSAAHPHPCIWNIWSTQLEDSACEPNESGELERSGRCGSLCCCCSVNVWVHTRKPIDVLLSRQIWKLTIISASRNCRHTLATCRSSIHCGLPITKYRVSRHRWWIWPIWPRWIFRVCSWRPCQSQYAGLSRVECGGLCCQSCHRVRLCICSCTHLWSTYRWFSDCMLCSLREMTKLGLQGNDLRDLPECFAKLTKLSTSGLLRVTDALVDCSNIRCIDTLLSSVLCLVLYLGQGWKCEHNGIRLHL